MQGTNRDWGKDNIRGLNGRNRWYTKRDEQMIENESVNRFVQRYLTEIHE